MDKQLDSFDALSRCHCCERRLNKVSKIEGIRKFEYAYHFLPKIVKISRCLLKLQLAKVGLFFATQCRGLPVAHAYQIWLMSIATFVCYLADTQTHADNNDSDVIGNSLS